MAERLRRIIEKEIIPFDEKEIKVTVSVGVSEIAKGYTAGELIKRGGQRALYGKERGAELCKGFPQPSLRRYFFLEYLHVFSPSFRDNEAFLLETGQCPCNP